MASTISAATLTVTFTESIVLNGSNMGATNTLSVSSINEINQRIVSLDASNERTLFEFSTIIGPGKFIKTDVKYIRITNKDDTNGVSLNLESATSNCWIVVLAGQSFILSSATAAIEADDDTTIAAPTLQDMVKINAHSANPIDLDCYIALT
jgi:uncharacterized small protein (DUF1192 family)